MIVPILILLLILFLEKIYPKPKLKQRINVRHPQERNIDEIIGEHNPYLGMVENFDDERDRCSLLQRKIKTAVGGDGTCVFDYDNTITDDHGNLSRCTKDCVSVCPEVAMNTYNSAQTYDACCTNPILLEAGLCPYGKCIVSQKNWAHRSGMMDFKLNGKIIGNVFTTGMKTDAMDLMKLDKNKTILIDDRVDNLVPAKERGYHVLHVPGENGL